MYNLSLDLIILFYTLILGIYISLKLFYDYKLLRVVNALLRVPREIEKGQDAVIDLSRLLSLVKNIHVHVSNISTYSMRDGMIFIRANTHFFSVVVSVTGSLGSYRIVRHVRVT